jgi:hypothetical protein
MENNTTGTGNPETAKKFNWQLALIIYLLVVFFGTCIFSIGNWSVIFAFGEALHGFWANLAIVGQLIFSFGVTLFITGMACIVFPGLVAVGI